jgi:hypothetical protein
MVTTPATLVDGVLTNAATMNTHTTAITELQTTINAQSVMELTSTATQSIPNATWTAVVFSATPTYTNGSGNLTGTTGGITVAVAGRYILEGIAIFVANGTGSRLISINTVAAGIGSTTIQTSTIGNAVLPLVQALRQDALAFKPSRYTVMASTDDGYVNVDASLDAEPRVWAFTVVDVTAAGAPVYVTDDQADAYAYASDLNGALQL